MTRHGSHNLPEPLAQVEAVYRDGAPECSPEVTHVPAEPTGEIAAMTRLSLEAPRSVRRLRVATARLHRAASLSALLPRTSIPRWR